jgi:deazaflavin-dependent oxidoreductase (nitroreductase family)
MSTKLMRSGPARLFNSLVLRFAGTRYFPLYGVIEHRGRRSGRIFHTPVVVRPVADGFVVPMPWGERTDWYRNVRAAGGCAILWKGRRHQVDRPETVDTRAVMSAFNSFERAIMSRLGINQCLRLRHQT